MLKLTLRPGEFIDIGENIRVVFSGGSSNNIHLLVDAPRELNIARSNAGGRVTSPYYREEGISEEAKRQIRGILRREKERTSGQMQTPEQRQKKGIYVVHHS